MTKENRIVPVILTNNLNSQPSTSVQKPKLTRQLKIGRADLRVYNGASQYILTTILKELVHANVKHIFIVCGKTDMRRGIDGLASVISDTYNLDLFDDAIFLFCGGRTDRFKALFWDENGFILLYKRFETGKPQWARKTEEVKSLTSQELRWLLEGLAIQQPKALRPSLPGKIN